MEIFKDKAAKHKKVINAFIDPVIEEAIARKKEKAKGGKEDEDEGRTVLDALAQQTDDPVLIRDETINLLIAGKETTTSALSFVVYMLAEYPSVLRKLRDEVLQRVGPTRRPTYEDIKEMKYLRAVINETLRLYPPSAINARASVKATTFPPTTPGSKPFFIPAKSQFMYSVFIMQRRKDLWGPDALEFDPERWLDDRLQKYFIPNPFIFLPFGAGARICLGQQLVYNQISFFMIRFLQSFSNITLDLVARPESTCPPDSWKTYEGRRGKEKVMTDTQGILVVKDALWVNLEEASDM
jgi:cytochrome P450